LDKIKLLYVFKVFYKNSNVFIVTNDDKVYAFGNNSNGVLGFGNYKAYLIIKKEFSL
jgi:alpha-tubulin suppressor-like RCC1 family protein